MKLTYCSFVDEGSTRTFMILRAHLGQLDAAYYCGILGLITGAGEFDCRHLPDDLVELFAEHAERVLTESKAKELFGDNWLGGFLS